MANRLGSLSLGMRVIARELRSQPSVVISIAVTTLIASVLLAAAPRQLEVVSAEDLRATVSEPDPAQRNIRVERFGRLGAGPDDDPMRSIRESGDFFAEMEFPPSLQEIVSDHYYLVDTPRFAVSPMPGEEPPHPFPRFLSFRYQEHIDDQSMVVEGELPSPQDPITMLVGTDCPLDPDERAALEEELESGAVQPAEDSCRLEDVAHYQVAISARTAEDMGLEVGSQVVLTPDATDPLFNGIPTDALAYQIVVSVSGIIELTAVEDEYWYADPTLHRPTIRETADFRIIFATGLMAPEDYRSMLSTMGDAGRSYVWRHFVDPDLVETADLDTLQSELEPFLLRFTPVVARPTDYRVISQLSDLIQSHLEQRSHTVAMVSLAVAGILTVVVTVTLLLAVLMTGRQRRSIVLERNRGASRGQLTLTRIYEGLLIVVPGALLGFLAAALLFTGTDYLFSYRATTILVLASLLVLVAAGLPLFTRRLGSLQREYDNSFKSSPGRVVAEVLLVTLAIGTFFLLQRRGEADDLTTDGEFDLLLALAPALIAVASGLVAMRIYPLFIRSLGWVASKRPGVVGFVGFKRILSQPSAARLPVLVFVVCVATAITTSITADSIRGGQETGSWQVVGADYSVKGFGPDVNIPGSVDVESLGPHSASALGKTFPNARIQAGVRSARTEALAIDATSYQTLTEGTAGDVALPAFLSGDPGPDAGTASNPIPVIISANWPADIDPSVGDVITLDLGTLRLQVVVRETRDRYPDIATGVPFVVVGLDALATFDQLSLTPTVAYLRATRDAGDELAANLDDQAPSARLISRYETLDSIIEDPFIGWAVMVLQVLFYFAVTFAVVAVVASLAVASSTRRRDLAYLRTLGLDTGQATGMTVIEQLPPTLVGTAFGALVGVMTALGLGQVFNLDVFTGGAVPAPIVIDWTVVVLVAAAIFGVLAAAVVIFVIVNRRVEVSRVLRVGEE
ncbi:MAG TPA: ABC transporter permease [Acidimicrobiia bacterium]|nr:ABC transporter permease [Acidimicrobiia bacterium]